MSDYTPSAEELVLAAVNIPEAEARRGIAKVKADALREWAGLVKSELEATASHGIDLGEKYLHGARSMLSQADEHADRIEREA